MIQDSEIILKTEGPGRLRLSKLLIALEHSFLSHLAERQMDLADGVVPAGGTLLIQPTNQVAKLNIYGQKWICTVSIG